MNGRVALATKGKAEAAKAVPVAVKECVMKWRRCIIMIYKVQVYEFYSDIRPGFYHTDAPPAKQKILANFHLVYLALRPLQ